MTTDAYWTEMLAKSGALVIDGDLYFVGSEPTHTDLLANPKRYGCYGMGFRIRHLDGTETVTHNLGHCGTIPAHLRLADNAAFVGDPEPTPIPHPAAHNCLDCLDYIGGSYPYECVFCYRRYEQADINHHLASVEKGR
jgi:hypothetical protein